MFYDQATVEIQAGKGGNGCISFRREKFVPRGGPDGGDGGSGGDVIFAAGASLRDLAFLRRRRKLNAGNGRAGEGNKKHGSRGRDLLIEVPCGTQVFEQGWAEKQGSGAAAGAQHAALPLADLVAAGQRYTIAHGGEGGRGNARFATSTRRAPRFAELGLPGERKRIMLKLKLLADAGLLGFPNAGKSSLIRIISNAKPKVADYPFTTVAPMLGTVEDPRSRNQFTIADIPGLLEGASRGSGLGDEFLAHLERSSLLIHLVDVNGYYGKRPLQNFKIINRELAGFSRDLAAKPQFVVVNKTDLVSEERAGAVARSLAAEVARRFRVGDPAFAWLGDGEGHISRKGGPAVLMVSAATGQGAQALISRVFDLLARLRLKLPAKQAEQLSHVIYRPGEREGFSATAENGRFFVRGRAVEKLVARIDFGNDEAVSYLKQQLERLGVSEALRQAGARRGQAVQIGGTELEFW